MPRSMAINTAERKIRKAGDAVWQAKKTLFH